MGIARSSSVAATALGLSLSTLSGPASFQNSALVSANFNNEALSVQGADPVTRKHLLTNPSLELESLASRFALPQLTASEEAQLQKTLQGIAAQHKVLSISVQPGVSLVAAADTVIMTLLTDREILSQFKEDEASKVIVALTNEAKLNKRAIAFAEWFLTHTKPDSALDHFVVSVASALPNDPEARLLLAKVALYHLDGVLAARAMNALAGDASEANDWLKSQRTSLAEIREGRVLGQEGRVIAHLTVLGEDFARLNDEVIPGLNQKISEHEARIEQLEKDKRRLEKENKRLEEAKKRADEERARQLQIENSTRRVPGIKITRFAGYGSSRGALNDDLIPEGARITAIGCRYGRHLDSIWLVYEKDGQVSRTPRRGGNGGQEMVVNLDQDEYIRIFGHSGRKDPATYVQVYTNKRSFTLGSARREDVDVLDRAIDGTEYTKEQRRDENCNVVTIGIRVRSDNLVRCVAAIAQVKPEEPTK